MKFEIDRAKYIDTGLINEQVDSTGELLIYNYSQACQFSRAWDEVTLMCRGLIVNKETREIVARPFSKFFNYEEHVLTNKIPDEQPFVLRKFDGSLGILYWHRGEPFIATRGSFNSEQAKWATEWIRKNLPCEKFDKKTTYLFEIIYPQNRIVVNYGFSGLVLLEAIDLETGRRARGIPVPKETMLPELLPFTSYEALKALNEPNEEGFVLLFPTSELRLKIKFADYVRLHKVMTGLSEIGIWEMLKDGKNPFTPEIPDEMFKWIEGVAQGITGEFFAIESIAMRDLAEIKELLGPDATRKDLALYIQKKENPGVIFSMLDGKDYKSAIWKMVRPRGAHVFHKDIDS